MAAIVALFLIAGAALWFTNRSTTDRSTASDPTPSTATSATAAPSTAPSSPPPSSAPSSSPPSASPKPSSTSTGSGLPALPAGWQNYHDKTGFSIYVPKGWSKSQKGTMVYFRGAGRVLGIDQSDHPKSDPLADWREQSSYRVSHGYYPGYHLVRMVSVDYQQKAADWEYTFTQSGTRVHVDNRNIVASSHKAYAIYWQTPDSEWSAHKNDLALIYASFRPAK